MSDHPILYSGTMVRAMIEGRKTQTRRFCPDQPPAGVTIIRKMIQPFGKESYHAFERRTKYGNFGGDVKVKISRGDRLWVREAWRTLHANDCLAPRQLADDPSKITYEADPENRNPLWAFGRLRASMHMPRWASRLTLIVTDVRVERLQDISAADAIAEGIERHRSGWMPYSTAFYDGDGITPANYHADPRISYMQLWDSINGSGSWEANPWIVAYSFRIIKANIDAVAA